MKGKPKVPPNCLLPTCINIDVAETPRYDGWIPLIEMQLSDLLSCILHAYSVMSQRKTPFSSQTGLVIFHFSGFISLELRKHGFITEALPRIKRLWKLCVSIFYEAFPFATAPGVSIYGP